MYYITAATPATSVGAAIPGLQAVAVSPDGQTAYAVNTSQNLLVVANTADLTQRQTFQDGVQGVSGLAGAVAMAVSPDGNAVYVAGGTDGEIAVFARASNGDLTFEGAISAGIGDLTSLVVSGSADSSTDLVFVGGSGGVAAFQGNTTGATAADQLQPVAQDTGIVGISDLAVSRDGTLVLATSPSADAVYVLDSSSLATIGSYTTASVTSASGLAPSDTLEGASDVAVSVDDQFLFVTGATSGTLTVLERDLATNTFTWVQTLEDGVEGARGLADATDLIVSRDGQYVYVTSGADNSLAIYGIQSDGTLIRDQILTGSLGLGDPGALAGDAADDVIYVASQTGNGLVGGGLASFEPVPPAVSAGPSSLTVSWSAMQTVHLTVGPYQNTISETNYATVGPGSTTPATLDITAGNGLNTVDLLDVDGTTTVTTGSGQDQFTVDATHTKTNLTINAGGGNDYVELDHASTRDVITINLGNGNSTAMLEGTALPLLSSVAVNGGTGYDTLLFDAKGNPIVAYDSSGNVIADDQPALPNGEIQSTGGTYAIVDYTLISNIPGYAGAVVSAGGPYTITEGQDQPVTLSGSATPATDTTIIGESWDLNGDGVFGDATGLDPTITWDQLVALGIDGPGTYRIAMRVESDTNTVTAYATLTVQSVAPTVTVSGSGSTTLGVSYPIAFSATEVAGVNYGVTGWSINWGDGTTTALPGGATASQHIYTTPGSYSIIATATDPYGSYSGSTPVVVAAGSDSVGVGGPYEIQTGQSLTLTAVAAGTPTAFGWNLTGDGNFSEATTTTVISGNGSSTGQVTLSWAELQALGLEEGTYGDVRVEAEYGDGSTATSAPTSLVIDPTPPSATFTGTNTVIGGSSSVSFTNPADLSKAQQADGYTYSYDFLDNGTFEISGSTDPTAAVPADLLAQPGSFVVHGRITAEDGTYSDYYTSITVGDAAPTVSVGLDQAVAAGTPFVLSGVTFSDPGYATSAGSWDFTSTIDWGDGTTSVGTLTVTQGSAGVPTTGIVTGTHLYRPDQADTVTITVIDSEGESGSASFQVTVGHPVLTLSVGSDQTVPVGSTFEVSQTTFTDTAAPDTDSATIDWGDGSPVETVPAANISEPAAAGDPGTIDGGHIYGAPGTYTVTVSVDDGYGDTQSGSFEVQALDVAPTVVPGPDLHQSPGVPVSLTSTFSDPGFAANGSGVTYSATIDWGDGTTSPATVTVTQGSAGVPTVGTISATHTYARHGNDTITVTVTDSQGLQGSATLNALDVPPTVVAGPDETVNQGSPVDVDATFTDPGYEVGATTASYPATIDWGDGTTSVGTVTLTPGGPGVPTVGTIMGSHVYDDAGQYDVTVSVADDAGGTAQGSFTATVQDVGPTLAPLANRTYEVNDPFQFVETFTEPGIDDQDTVVVDWGDGTTTTITPDSFLIGSSGTETPLLVEPTATSPGSITLGHEYGDAGPHTVSIAITDEDGLSDTVSALFSASTNATTSTTLTSSAPGDTSAYGQPVTFTAAVSVPGSSTSTPTGTVTFFDGTASSASPCRWRPSADCRWPR